MSKLAAWMLAVGLTLGGFAACDTDEDVDVDVEDTADDAGDAVDDAVD
ncbi:MAG: hypothetical protein ABR599_06730 [Gemmatimonadota bacterium]